MKNTVLVIVILVLCSLVLTGCADHVDVIISREPVGFIYGLWHGMILPLSWLFSLFNNDIAIYAVYNNGSWYDFGFILGVASVWGSSAAS